MAKKLESIQYLKQVSRVKHKILESYLRPWAVILGSANQRLAYIDCFAGGGTYTDENEQLLLGSPLVAIRSAKEYVRKSPGSKLLLGFIEKNSRKASVLRDTLAKEPNIPRSIQYFILEEDAQDAIERLVTKVKESSGRRLVPTFFFVDPYGHPISIPVMRNLLELPQTEIFVNLMWFRLNMDLNNPKAKARIDRLFGHSQWQQQNFMSLKGRAREHDFIEYFVKEIGASYNLRFLVHFSPEDRVKGGSKRTKFYLVHFSNHPKAALLMKHIMWNFSDEAEELEFSGRGEERQLKLFGSEPDLEQLRGDLLNRYAGTELAFERIQIETFDWPFVERDYRETIKQLEKEGLVVIKRVKSKKTGLADSDIVVFP